MGEVLSSVSSDLIMQPGAWEHHEPPDDVDGPCPADAKRFSGILDASDGHP